MLIKTIYIYWAQGFENAHEIVKICLNSWKTMNPNWNIVELNDTNLGDYIDIDDIRANSNIAVTAMSDVIRIALLQKWGGVWTDATCFCRVSLDDWLPKYTKNGFWAFSKPEPSRLVSSWFLYGTPQNYIVQRWYKKTMNFWTKRTNGANGYKYYWFHFLFNEMYKNDKHIRKMWNDTKQLSAQMPHIFQTSDKGIPLCAIASFNNGKVPVYKLSYKKEDHQICEWNTFFKDKSVFLMNPTTLRFLHIPKNAGTSIEEMGLTLMRKWGKYDTKLKTKNNAHAWHTPQPIGNNAFCVIRNPFNKLLSEFRHEVILNSCKRNMNPNAHYNAKSLNNWIQYSLEMIKKNPHYMDNHFLHQHYYSDYCKHILLFEHIQEDFDALLTEYNLPLTQLPKLPGGKLQQSHRSKTTFSCKLTKRNISPENLQKIQNLYAKDIDLWEKHSLLREDRNIVKAETVGEKQVHFE